MRYAACFKAKIILVFGLVFIITADDSLRIPFVITDEQSMALERYRVAAATRRPCIAHINISGSSLPAWLYIHTK